jgi:hypothetical protein
MLNLPRSTWLALAWCYGSTVVAMTYFGHCLGADIAAYFGNLVAVLLAFLLGIISLVLASIVGLGMYWGLK